MKLQTIGELATALTIKHQRAVPDWKLRRVCDELYPNLPRIGVCRAVPESLIPFIENALRNQGWLPLPTGGDA